MRKHHCFYCGEEIGDYDKFSDIYDTCGKRECEREARYQQAADCEERREAAEEDCYSRY